MAALDARQAYLDGELCGVGPDGVTMFNIVQLASDSGNAAALVFFLFDLLYFDGQDLRPRPLIERKERLRTLLANAQPYLLHLDGEDLRHSNRKNTSAAALPRSDASWTMLKEVMPSAPTPHNSPSR